MTVREVVAVFSGGGVKAMAHIGAMRALAEAGIRPTRFIGTSMGAAVAAGFAAGLTPDKLHDRLAGIRRRDVAAVRPMAMAKGLFATAIFRAAPLRQTIERILPVARFSDLRLPLTVTAADLDTGDLVCFGHGGEDAPLVDAIHASCALPLLFAPVVIGGRRLADGGLRGVVGLDVARREPADLVVAVDVGPGFDMDGREGPSGLPPAIRIHNEAQWVLMADASRLQLELWRATPGLPRLLYVRPRVRHGGTFAVDQAGYYLDEGYRATREAVGA